jgi:hypothetical protein
MWCRFLAIVLLAAPAWAQTKQGSPLNALPKNIQILTYFGERADFSPDNARIAFMAKSFGDAFTIDLKTKIIRCLTCNVPGAAFLRVMHLKSGDYLLIGPERFKDIRDSRQADNELWFLSREPGSKPVKLGQKMSEGAAVSKTSMRIAFSQTRAQTADLGDGQSRMIVAEVDPIAKRLVNPETVLVSKDRGCVLEAQDFTRNESVLTYSCYEPQGKASVRSIDLNTKAVTDHSKRPGRYNEVEGILPGGDFTLVESDEQAVGREGGFRQIDIWKLKLDGTGKDFVRLTRFNDFTGWKASNPVVSTDGQWMAFQVAKTADEAGVGYGILLYRLP